MNDGTRNTRVSSWLLPLIAINVIVFFFTRAGQGNAVETQLILHPYWLRHGQIWRLVTYQFVHAGFSHLFFNMWGLYVFGRLVEQTVGPRKFLSLYLASGIIGGLVWLLFNGSSPLTVKLLSSNAVGYSQFSSSAELDHFLRVSHSRILSLAGGVVGASGSVFGVMTAAAMLYPNLPIMMAFPPITMKLRTMLWIYMAIEVFSQLMYSGNVAHLAHLGGALGGFLFLRREQWHQWLQRRFPRHGSDPSPTSGPSRLRTADEQEITRILHKMSTLGYNKLTEEEKRRLEEATDRTLRR